MRVALGRVTLLLAVIMGVAGCGQAGSASQGGTASHTVSVADSVRTFVAPADMELFEFRGERITQAGMERLAQALGLKDVAYSSAGFSNADYAVEFPRGDVIDCFTVSSKKGIDEYVQAIDKGQEPPACPSEDQAIKLADALLQSLGLMDGLELNDVIVQDQITSGDKTYDLTRAVSYQARLGGLPFLGPGAKVSVAVGPGDELVRMEHWLVASTPGPMVQVRPVDVALKDIETGKGLPPARMTRELAKNITVTDVSLAYWAEPILLQEKYHKPVYVFSVVDAGGTAGQWIVSAVADGATIE